MAFCLTERANTIIRVQSQQPNCMYAIVGYGAMPESFLLSLSFMQFVSTKSKTVVAVTLDDLSQFR
ncbi:hypothetical protein CIP107541_01288 [Corynebacterium diphtheriae]|nr:hypothetical protein B9J72_06410 [Corynebacterium diphtheriae]CAB0601549.1 hypothetical protein CIP107541_01288 [Corynebacterium diphtheriae]VEJ63966.1 Uncharacterised protein [Corynebacterium diphtheriae]